MIVYVLMGNHYQMVIETPIANLGEFMRHFYTERVKERLDKLRVVRVSGLHY